MHVPLTSLRLMARGEGEWVRASGNLQSSPGTDNSIICGILQSLYVALMTILV